jgi:hypothetical protein
MISIGPINILSNRTIMRNKQTPIINTLIAEEIINGLTTDEIEELFLNDRRIIIREELIRIALRKEISNIRRSLYRADIGPQIQLFSRHVIQNKLSKK